jgi:hypothetical protein
MGPTGTNGPSLVWYHPQREARFQRAARCTGCEPLLSPNGASYESPGHRPGDCPPMDLPSPERAAHPAPLRSPRHPAHSVILSAPSAHPTNKAMGSRLNILHLLHQFSSTLTKEQSQVSRRWVLALPMPTALSPPAQPEGLAEERGQPWVRAAAPPNRIPVVAFPPHRGRHRHRHPVTHPTSSIDLSPMNPPPSQKPGDVTHQNLPLKLSIFPRGNSFNACDSVSQCTPIGIPRMKEEGSIFTTQVRHVRGSMAGPVATVMGFSVHH